MVLTGRPLVRDIKWWKYNRPSTEPQEHERVAGYRSSRFGYSWLRDDARPHITCILEHAVPPEESLLRNEVLTILGLMRGRLAGHTLKQHQIIPVCQESNPIFRISLTSR